MTKKFCFSESEGDATYFQAIVLIKCLMLTDRLKLKEFKQIMILVDLVDV